MGELQGVGEDKLGSGFIIWEGFFFNFYNRVKNKKENCLKNYYLMWLEIWLSSSENVMLLQRSYVY